jgi:hypothetical protein
MSAAFSAYIALNRRSYPSDLSGFLPADRGQEKLRIVVNDDGVFTPTRMVLVGEVFTEQRLVVGQGI